jgi:hypothetical protein
MRLPFFALPSAKLEFKRRASAAGETDRRNGAPTEAAAFEGRGDPKSDDGQVTDPVCPQCKCPVASSKTKKLSVCKCRKSSGRSFFRRDPRRHSHAGTSAVADGLRHPFYKTPFRQKTFWMNFHH